MARERKSFTPEFKREPLRLVRESGRPVTQVARELGVKVHTLRAWKRDAAAHERADQVMEGTASRMKRTRSADCGVSSRRFGRNGTS